MLAGKRIREINSRRSLDGEHGSLEVIYTIRATVSMLTVLYAET